MRIYNNLRLKLLSLIGFFLGCPNATTCTLILRGGSEQFLEETERSLHDAIMIVRRTIRNDSVIAGKSSFSFFFILETEIIQFCNFILYF